MGYEIRFLPLPKLIFRTAIGDAHIASDSGVLGPIRFPIQRVVNIALAHSSFRSPLHFIGRNTRSNFDVKSAPHPIGHKASNHVSRSTDDPTRGKWHHPPSLRTSHFRAIQISLRT